jgi:hypothetical protein
VVVDVVDDVVAVEAESVDEDVFLHELISGATATKPKAVKPFFKNDLRSIIQIVIFEL